MIEPFNSQLHIPDLTREGATFVDAEYDTDFFAPYEVELEITNAETARAHLAIHGLIGTFFVVMAVLAIYVMFAFPQTGDI